MKPVFSLFACGLLLASALPVRAQDPAPDKKAEQQGRHIRGLSFRIKEQIKTVYAYGPKLEPVKLEVKDYLNDAFSALPVNAGTDLVLTNSPDPASVKDPEAILAKFSISPSLKSAVFMFLPGTAKPGDPKYRVLVMDDGVLDFPAGSLKVMNLSPIPVRLQLEDKDYDFKSGEMRVIKNPPTGANHQASMTVSTFKDSKWTVFGNSVFPDPGPARVFQVYYQNTVTGKVEMSGIRDVAFRNP